MKRVYVLGHMGMVGHAIFKNLVDNYSDKYDVLGFARNANSNEHEENFNFLNDTHKYLVDYVEPDIVINCLGVLVAGSEEYPNQAIYINSYIPRVLETYYSHTKTKIIHLSTDCVFSGSDGGYVEQSTPDGKGIYPKTKALGEIKNDKDLTIRTSFIGATKPHNEQGLFNWFIRQKKAKGFFDSYWTGVTNIEIAKAIPNFIEQNITGLYHFVPENKIHKTKLLEIIAKEFNKDIKIIGEQGESKDKSLIDTRKEFDYKIPSYEDMIKELKQWIYDNKDLYPQYRGVLYD